MVLKIYTILNKVKFSSEILLLGGLLEKEPEEKKYFYRGKDDSRYKNLISFCNEKIIYVDDPREADVMVFPYKFNGVDDKILRNMIALSKKFKKKLLCFYNDDDEKSYRLPSHVKLWRTSFLESKRKENELSMPALTGDRHDNSICTRLSIGFVGHSGCGRKKYIDALRKSSIETNFIIRSGFLAPEVSREKATTEFHDNISNNAFIFCYRGGGNFSYRFYETLMRGRIPILVLTDSSLPFENVIDYDKHCVIIDENKLHSPGDIEGYILLFYNRNKNSLHHIERLNRKLWEDYFSATGFVNKLIETYTS